MFIAAVFTAAKQTTQTRPFALHATAPLTAQPLEGRTSPTSSTHRPRAERWGRPCSRSLALWAAVKSSSSVRVSSSCPIHAFAVAQDQWSAPYRGRRMPRDTTAE